MISAVAGAANAARMAAQQAARQVAASAAKSAGATRPASIKTGTHKASMVPRDTFERAGATSKAWPTTRPQQFAHTQLKGKESQTKAILEHAARQYDNQGRTGKADELRQILKTYNGVAAMPNKTKGYNCTSFKRDGMRALQNAFGKNGTSSWGFDSIGVGDKDPASGSRPHQAVAIIDKDTHKIEFVLDPTKMSIPKIGAFKFQGKTDGWNQAYYFDDWLRTRQTNYGKGWELSVP